MSIEDVVASFGFILTKLMIRRTPSLPWFGRGLVKLPPLNKMDILCPLEEKWMNVLNQASTTVSELDNLQYRKRLLKWKEGGSKGEAPRKTLARYLMVAHKLRLYTTIPGLAMLAEKYDLGLLAREIPGCSILQAPSCKGQCALSTGVP